MTQTSAGDVEAVVTAFDHVPVILSFSEGEDLEVTASNRMARAVFPECRADAGGDPFNPGTESGLAACIRDVARLGKPFVGREWRLEVQDADGRDVEKYLDFTMHPCFRPDGSVRGVISMATDVTDSVLQRGSALAPVREGRARRTDARKLGISFQEALLPDGLPISPGLRLAARYVIAEPTLNAGGDWFDAVALEDGRVALVVGDVVGYGVHASLLMGELRTLFNERVRADGDIVAALRLLEGRAQHSPDALATTVCAAVLDPASGRLTYCTAGHPPPLVVSRNGEATYLPATGAGLLGAGHPFAVADYQLDEGELLLLYSDGIVARPGRTPAQNAIELSLIVAEACARSRTLRDSSSLVESVCAETLEMLTRSTGCQDDFSILAAERMPPAEDLEVVLPARPDTLGVVRERFAAWLAPLRVDRIHETAMQHSLGELVDNVIEHAYDPHEPPSRAVVEVRARLAGGGVVEIEVADYGQWRPPPDTSSRGRGLAMVRGFSEVLGLRHDDTGTTALSRHRPRASVELLAIADGHHSTDAGREALDVRHEGGRLVVRGAIDQQSVDALRHQLARATYGGVSDVRIDLTDVTVLASCGVQALCQAMNDGGSIELLAPLGTPAQHVLDLVRLPYRS